MKRTIAILIFVHLWLISYCQVIDHNCTNLNSIPSTYITHAKTSLHIAYEHTSHGSQIIDGMTGLYDWKGIAYAYNKGGINGALDIHDNGITGGSDLGSPDWTSWAASTRTYLQNPANSKVNVVMWAWCGQVSTATESNINTYLSLMSSLETEFTHVRFIYMTGHLDGTGVNGTLNIRNEQIRSYCRNNNKILYDFADIESYDPDNINYLNRNANDNCDYDSNNDGSPDRNWATVWQNSHTINVDWYNCVSAHSQPLNANRKAYAAWWLWARLAGWNGLPPEIPVTGITVNSAGLESTITIDNGTLQLYADVLPSNATNKSVAWSIAGGTGQASVSPSGLVTAITDGTVTAVATSTDGTAISGIIEITITNQVIPVSGITIMVEGGSNVIFERRGSLQLATEVSPAIATNKNVEWSIVNITGLATIDNSGLVTAIDNGLVTVVASAADGSGVRGSLDIKIKVNEQLTVIVTENLLKIPLEGNYQGARVRLFDLKGNLVSVHEINGNSCEFDISSIPDGIYIVALSRSFIMNVAKVFIGR